MDPIANIGDIRHAYRLLLGREADESGLALYTSMIHERAITAQDLATIFLGSEEFATKDMQRSRPVEVELDGYSIFVRADDTAIGSWILKHKDWEPHVAGVMKRLVQPGFTFVDVGANVGYFAAMAANLVGPQGKVIAIEPLDKNVQLIYASRWRNKFHQLAVFPFAASDERSIVPMDGGAGTSNGSISARRTTAEIPNLFAQTERLDDLLGELDALHVVKLDIEGFESKALAGFERNLTRHRPHVLTEYHPKCMVDNAGVEPHAYLAILFDYGRQVTVLRANGQQVPCSSIDAVQREWASLDEELGMSGNAHLDLYIEPNA